MSDRRRDDDSNRADDDAGKYVGQKINLTASHRWKAAPGYNILVLDAGAVRLDYPHAWKVIPKANRLQIHDRPPPDDEGRFQITVFNLPKLDPGSSWKDLSLEDLLRKATTADPPRKKGKPPPAKRTLVHDVTMICRPDLEYAWTEHQSTDRENGRAIFSRQVIARARGVQPLITFDYYVSRAVEYRPVWQHAMDSLRLGSPVNLLGDMQN
jgi:hypothetical protein